MFTACNEAGQVKSHTTRQFYELATYKRSAQTVQAWYKSTPDVQQIIMEMPSAKTSSLGALQAYVQYLLPVLGKCLRFHMQKAFRGLKFSRYIFALKQLQAICREDCSSWQEDTGGLWGLEQQGQCRTDKEEPCRASEETRASAAQVLQGGVSR